MNKYYFGFFGINCIQNIDYQSFIKLFSKKKKRGGGVTCQGIIEREMSKWYYDTIMQIVSDAKLLKYKH